MSLSEILARPSSRPGWLVLLLIFAAAFAIRLIYLSQIAEIPTFDNPDMDEHYHVELAQRINDAGYGNESFFRAPFYLYFLAATTGLTGGSLYWARFIQILLGALLPVLVYLFAAEVFGRSIGSWSAVIAAFYPTFLYYDAALLITSAMVLFTTLLVFQLYRTARTPNVRNFVLVGVILGLAGLARPNILLLGPALFLWIWLELKPRLGWPAALRSYLIIGLTSVVIIAPVTIRNYLASGEFVLISWQGGFNFFLGNNRQASGWSATTTGIDETWEGGYLQSISIAEADSNRKLKRSEVSGYWYGRAWDEIKASRLHFISLIVKKARLFMNGYEIPNNQNLYIARNYSSVMWLLMFNRPFYFPFGLLLPLALVGLAATICDWRKYLLCYLVLGSYLTTLLLFFVCARFRQPVIPILIPFAVLGVQRMIHWFRIRDVKKLALTLVLLVLLLAESNHDLLGLRAERIEAEDHLMLGNAYVRRNDLPSAFAEFKLSVQSDDSYALGFNNLGVAYEQMGFLAPAIENYIRAIELDPAAPDARVNLAAIYLKRNDIESAILTLEQARQIQPMNHSVHLNLAMTYYEAGRLDEAVRSCRQAMQLNPDDPTLVRVCRGLTAGK
jgi:tetratricopeptide (TPR) repeat protein